MAQAPNALAPSLPAYDVQMNHTIPARYRAASALEAFATPLSL